MDDLQPQNSKLKTYVIAGSIAAVVVGLIVVGLLIYRQRALNATPPASGPNGPTGSATSPTGTLPGGGQGQPTTPGEVSTPDKPIFATPPDVPPTIAPDDSNGPDADGDGLSDREEADYGTDPHKADTDGDGFSDYQEIRVYGTDPLDAKANPNTVQGLYSPNKGNP